MTPANGIEQRFIAVERDVRGLEEDSKYARDQRGKLWDHMGGLEKDMAQLTSDVATCKRLAGEAADNSAKTREWVEQREKEAEDEKRLSRGQFWTIVGIVVMLIGVLLSAGISVIQLMQG